MTTIIILATAMGLVGFFIGKGKDRALEGALLGFMFGPLGWIVTLLLPGKVTAKPLPADYLARRNSPRYGNPLSPERRAREEAWKRAQSGE